MIEIHADVKNRQIVVGADHETYACAKSGQDGLDKVWMSFDGPSFDSLAKMIDKVRGNS